MGVVSSRVYTIPDLMLLPHGLNHAQLVVTGSLDDAAAFCELIPVFFLGHDMLIGTLEEKISTSSWLSNAFSIGRDAKEHAKAAHGFPDRTGPPTARVFAKETGLLNSSTCSSYVDAPPSMFVCVTERLGVSGIAALFTQDVINGKCRLEQVTM